MHSGKSQPCDILPEALWEGILETDEKNRNASHGVKRQSRNPIKSEMENYET